MAIMKLEMSPEGYWYSDEDYGPPLPHSLWLWELWGCYEHYNCYCTSNLLDPKGQRHTTVHNPVEGLREEISRHSDNCECWRHWLLGDMADKDYPQTWEPIIRQSKKGRRDDEGS